MPFADALKQMPVRTKAVLAVSAVAILAIAFLLLKLAGAPAYTPIATGLDPAQTGKVTAALDEQGIAYELRANGTSVAVEKAQAATARVALAGAGGKATGGSEAGYELFDSQKLGASDFQQKVTYQRALEGEIARAIGSMEGVGGAQVQLVLPEDELFAETDTPATAAVILDSSADALEASSVRGIAQLVASSVKGLKTENVTITDAAGALLWPQGDGAASGPTGAGKQAAEARYESALEANLNALLLRTLGANKATVQVKADLNVDETTRESLKHATRALPVEESEETERLRGTGTAAGGTSGTAGNVPTYGSTTANGSNSNYQRSTRTTKNAYDKDISKTKVAPGKVEKLRVALMVDESITQAQLDALEPVVSAAAGVDDERGDTVQSMRTKFAVAPEAAKAGPIPMSLLGPLKYVGLGIAALLFLFFMSRHIGKRESEPLARPAWLADIQTPTPLSQLQPPTGDAAAPVRIPPREQAFELRALDEIVKNEPERLAAQVKTWMNDE